MTRDETRRRWVNLRPHRLTIEHRRRQLAAAELVGFEWREGKLFRVLRLPSSTPKPPDEPPPITSRTPYIRNLS